MKYQYSIGEVVLCFEPDSTKARVLYDAKVLAHQSAKDTSGKKRPAYLIHFQGWNSSWDRQVNEHYLLKNTDANRDLMDKLASTAKKFCKNNHQRRRKINAILHQAFEGALPQFDGYIESEESEDDVDPIKKGVKGRYLQDRKKQKTTYIEVEIPESLKYHLENDYILINKKNKLTRVPAQQSVIDILENFMKTFSVNYIFDPTGCREKTRNSNKHTLKCAPDKCVSLCKEFVDSLRIIFDFTLPVILLYAAEQQQYEDVMSNVKTAQLLNKDWKTKDRETKAKLQTETAKQERSAACLTEVVETAATNGDMESFPPQRRITRRSNYDPEITFNLKPPTRKQKSKTTIRRHKLSRGRKKKMQPIPISSRTRRRSQTDITVKQEPGLEVCEEEIDNPDQDMQDTQSETPQSNGIEKTEPALCGTGTESLTSTLAREDAMDRILSWQLLPSDVRLHQPVTPSQVYGVIHLLRLFVKLPELLQQMQIRPGQQQVLTKFIHHCLQYLSDHQAELFVESLHE